MKHYKDQPILKLINAISEYVVLIAAYYISGLIRVYIPERMAKVFWWADIVRFAPLIFVAGIVIVLIYYFSGDYSSIHIRNPKVEMAWVLLVQVVGTFIMSGLLFMANGGQFSRVWLVLFALVSWIGLFLKRLLFQFIAKKWFKNAVKAYNVLIIGNGNLAKRFYRKLKNIGEEHYLLTGYLADSPNKNIPNFIGDLGELNATLSNEDIDDVVIAVDVLTDSILKDVLTQCSVYGVNVYLIPVFGDYMKMGHREENRDPFIQTFGDDMKVFSVNAMNTSSILGVDIAITNMEKTIQDIESHIDSWRGKYICVSNVHTTVMAHDDEKYRKVQNGAVMALPDGGPLSAFSRNNGNVEAKRVTGPDLMREILERSAEHGWKHFFYGSKQETLDKLRNVLSEKYPGATVVGMISPPFRELTPDEDAEYVRQINDAKPDFLWVGLGAPKQEIWMAAHEDRINCLMMGVGAAFDYEAGNIKRAPKWMQRLSLEWLYRLLQDPKRLLKRYVTTNLKYLWLTRR